MKQARHENVHVTQALQSTRRAFSSTRARAIFFSALLAAGVATAWHARWRELNPLVEQNVSSNPEQAGLDEIYNNAASARPGQMLAGLGMFGVGAVGFAYNLSLLATGAVRSRKKKE